MKKIVTLMMFMVLTMHVAWADDVVTKDVNRLPSAARTVLQKEFPQAKISYIKIDKEFFQGATYEVRLTTGAEVEFDSEGRWTGVDCKQIAVPAYFVPAGIAHYIRNNFEGEQIVKIDRDRRGFSVELGNNLDVEFDRDGNFLRLED